LPLQANKYSYEIRVTGGVNTEPRWEKRPQKWLLGDEEKMNNGLNVLYLLSIGITALATFFMALFSGVLLKVNKRQHRLDYEQELCIYQCEPTFSVVKHVERDKNGSIREKGEPTVETQLACVLVNSSALPLVIKHINVELISKGGKGYHFVDGFIHDIASTQDIYGKPALPETFPAGILIKSVPWVISGKSFAVFSHKYTSIPLEYQGGEVNIEFTYYNEYKKQELKQKVKERLSEMPKTF